MEILVHYFATHGRPSVKDLIQFLTECTAKPEFDSAQKAQLRDAISELSNPDSELTKSISGHTAQEIAFRQSTNPRISSMLQISSLEDACKYCRVLDLMESGVPTIVKNKRHSRDQPLPRPKKVETPTKDRK